MRLTDRHVHRCLCGAWKLRSRECDVCRIFDHEACVRTFTARQQVETARRDADTIARRQAVLRGVA